MEPAAKDQGYKAVDRTPDMCVGFQINTSKGQTEGITVSFGDSDCIVNQPQRVMYGIILNMHIQCKKEFSIHSIMFKAGSEAFSVWKLCKTIEQCQKHFHYAVMQLVNHISESIQGMGSGDNFTPDNSKKLYIGNMKEVY